LQVSTAAVKELRQRTGAGIMDCKKALLETEGNLEKATEVLNQRGLTLARKKANRIADQGVIDAYVHPGGQVGAMVEVNCETDFVAKTDDFKKFVRDMAMQVAAANPLVVNREELPQQIIDAEKEVYRNQAINEKKPEKIIDRYVEGKLQKYYQEVCLMEQNYIKDPSKTVRDLMTALIAKTGENISIQRFSRFQLGG